MRKPTQREIAALWADVRKEFPDDEMMQEIHFVRLLHGLQTSGFSTQQRIRFYSSKRISKQSCALK